MKLLDFETKRISASGEFAGLASTFGGDPDRMGDVIARGAFTESLRRHKSDGTTPALLWHHDPNEPIGVLTSLTETVTGLAIEGKLSDTDRGRSAHALMKDKALSLSIGYRLEKGGAEYRSDGVRILKAIDLWEVSVVALPANTRARITQVKSIRDFEAVLRDEHGFSSRQARRLASGGWPAFTKNTPVGPAEIAEIFRSSARRFQGK